VAFVCPRFADGTAPGGAETLLKSLAKRLQGRGATVSFLTTCATDHFTWANTLPPGMRMTDGVPAHYFPVDERDVPAFLRAQQRLCARRPSDPATEKEWLQNGVNSSALCRHLRDHADEYDRIVVGPYLFSLSHAAAAVAPEKTALVPCLHDEPFARMKATRELFAAVRHVLFNSAPERSLATRLLDFPADRGSVVGMGLDPFAADPAAYRRSRGLTAPYLVYAGRREPLKGTPTLLDYFAAFRSRTGRDVRLVLTGAGPLDIPADCAPFVTDEGFVSEQAKHEIMAGALAFCHPSQNESLGIVLLEAWLAGAPALVRAWSEVLTDQCRRSGGGLWFRNYPEFEEELLLLLDHPRWAQDLARNGRDYVLREYAWPVVEQRLLASLQI
jgi:glycosyltransferase involved in cell wall biosynthesis